MSDRSGNPGQVMATQERVRIAPFAEFLRSGRVKEVGEGTATVSRELFLGLMEPFVRLIRFDRDFYRRKYADLAEAETKGLITNLHDHYINFGFYENRLPCAVEVDGAFYSREYPDVALGILENRVASAQAHFELSGYAEGRIPRKGWTFAEMLRA